MSQWTFLTNHAHVLVCIWRDPDLRLRDLALLVGITERATQRIVSDLVEGGYLDIAKEGRRNHYRVRPQQALRHPVESDTTLAALLSALGPHSGQADGQADWALAAEPEAEPWPAPAVARRAE